MDNGTEPSHGSDVSSEQLGHVLAAPATLHLPAPDRPGVLPSLLLFPQTDKLVKLVMFWLQ